MRGIFFELPASGHMSKTLKIFGKKKPRSEKQRRETRNLRKGPYIVAL
jgi:hypothetical protein